VREVRSGSWPRDNATEGVWGGLDRSVAAQHGRFEHIFSDFGLEATVVRRACLLRGCADGEPPALGLFQAPIAAISGLTPMMFSTRVRL
jgi:hypothetical protein